MSLSYIWKAAYDHMGSDLWNANASEGHVTHDDEDEYE